MSDPSTLRVAAVRPARVWQPMELLQGQAVQGSFVPDAWPTSIAKRFGEAEVISLPDPAPPSSEGPENSDETAPALAHDAVPHEENTAEVNATPPSSSGLDEAAIALIREEAFASGLAQGRTEMREELALEQTDTQAHDQSVLQALEKVLPQLAVQPEQLYEPLKRLALHLAEQLVLAELSLEPKAIERLVQRCVDELTSHDDAPILVALNPADLTALQALRQLATTPAESALRLQSDDTLLPGSVRVSANDTLVEDLIEHRLASLAQSLLLDDARWRAQTAFEPERLAAGRKNKLTQVEDAQARMTSPSAYAAVASMDDDHATDLTASDIDLDDLDVV